MVRVNSLTLEVTVFAEIQLSDRAIGTCTYGTSRQVWPFNEAQSDEQTRE